MEKEAELLEGYRGIREPADIPGRRFRIEHKPEMIVDVSADDLTSTTLDELDTSAHLRIPDNGCHLQNRQKICMIMPGAVFDEDGNRIGYGGGYYDKYLEWLEQILFRKMMMYEGQMVLEKYLCKMAVAFECQIIEKEEIPSEVYDVKVDCILTEGRSILLE